MNKKSTYVIRNQDIEPNDVLITNTMLKAVNHCLENDKIETGHLFDLSCFIEAMVLHNRLLVHPYDSTIRLNLTFCDQLFDEGILHFTEPIESIEIKESGMDFVKNIIYKKQSIKWEENYEYMFENDLHEWSDYWREDMRDYFFKEDLLSYKGYKFRSNKYYYNHFAESFLTHSSTLRLSSTWLAHTIVYWLIWDKLSISYYPSFDRIFLSNIIDRSLYSSLSRKAYQYITNTLDSNVSEFKKSLLPFSVPIPYLLTLVLSKISKPSEIIEAVLIERKKSENFRKLFTDFEISLKNTTKLGDVLKTRENIIQSFEAISKGYEVNSFKTIKEILSFAEAAISPLTEPLNPKSYSTSLLSLPIKTIRNWWKKRKIKYLVSFPRRVKDIKPLHREVKRLWKHPIPIEQVEELSNYISLSTQN